MAGVQRQPQRVVQRGLRYIQVRRPLNPLFGNSGKMHADGEHIHIRRHARRADRFGARQIRFGAAERLLRRLETFSRQDRAVIRADHAGNQLHPGPALIFSGHLPREVAPI